MELGAKFWDGVGCKVLGGREVYDFGRKMGARFGEEDVCKVLGWSCGY